MSLSDVNFCIMFPILMQIDPLMGTAGTYFPSADRNLLEKKERYFSKEVHFSSAFYDSDFHCLHFGFISLIL